MTTRLHAVADLHQVINGYVIFAAPDEENPPEGTFVQMGREDWDKLGNPVRVTARVTPGDTLNTVPDDLSDLDEAAAFIHPTVIEPAAEYLLEGVGFEDCATREEAVALALGVASGCWEDLSGAGEFQSDRAAAAYTALLKRLDELSSADKIGYTGEPALEIHVDEVRSEETGPLHNTRDFYCRERSDGDPFDALNKCPICTATRGADGYEFGGQA